jgi:hypothetical protein
MREIAATQILVRSRWLRGGDSFGLSGRSEDDVPDETRNADFAGRAYRDAASLALVSANVIHPLDIPVTVVLGEKGIIGKIAGGLTWTEAGDGYVVAILAGEGGCVLEPARDIGIVPRVHGDPVRNAVGTGRVGLTPLEVAVGIVLDQEHMPGADARNKPDRSIRRRE